jgi:hypothetical protein
MSSPAARQRTPDEKRAQVRERQKRWYARQHPRRHEKVPLVRVNDEIVGMLIDLDWLAASDAEDRQKIGSAISAMLKTTAREHRQRFC